MVSLRVAAIGLRGPRSITRALIPRGLDNLVALVRQYSAHHADVAADFGSTTFELPVSTQREASNPAHHVHVLATRADGSARINRVRSRIGLVLSAGGARGFAHLGIVRALREARVPIDLIGGCSMGAIAGAAVALEWDDAEIRPPVLLRVDQLDGGSFGYAFASRASSNGINAP